MARGASRDFHHGPCDPWEHATNGGSGLVREFMQEGHALFGNHEDMTEAERANIEEGQDIVILEHAMARDLAVKDSVEDGG